MISRHDSKKSQATANTCKLGGKVQDEHDHFGTLAPKRHAHRHFLPAQCDRERNYRIDAENTEQHSRAGKRRD
jgi:hypothetical protein